MADGAGSDPARPGGLQLMMTGAFDAPPERVFRMLTEPAKLARWWGPHGFSIPEIEIDLSIGGRYRFGMQPPEGELFHLTGHFLAIDRPTRLVYTFRWEEPTPDDRETVVALSLSAVGDATEVSLLQGLFATEERRSLHRNGWTDSFEKLRMLMAASS